MPFVTLELVEEGTLVTLQGITHLVVTDESLIASKSAFDMVGDLIASKKYQSDELACFGVSYFNEKTGKSSFGVYVKNVDTKFDETACGSGTSCIGIALAAGAKESIVVDVIQPTGESIRSIAGYSNEIDAVVKSEIAGKVSILFDGEYEFA